MPFIFFVLALCGLVFLYLKYEEQKQENCDLLKQIASLKQLIREIDNDEEHAIKFLYEIVVDRIWNVLQSQNTTNIDFCLCAKRIPRWLDEYFEHYSRYVDIPRRAVLKNYKRPRFLEDTIAWDIACVFRTQHEFPEKMLYRQTDMATKLVNRDINNKLDDARYFTRACAHYLLAGMLKEAHVDCVTSDDNIHFFSLIKKKWPNFTWTSEDEVGYLENEYDE